MARPSHALIVDDEAHVRTYLRMVLRELGITECREAAEASTAWEMIQAEKPDLLLLDINMPGANGLELLHELSENHPDIPVVVITSQTLAGTVQRAAELGAVGYVAKFTPKDQLIASLRDVIDSIGNEDPDQSADSGGI